MGDPYEEVIRAEIVRRVEAAGPGRMSLKDLLDALKALRGSTPGQDAETETAMSDEDLIGSLAEYKVPCPKCGKSFPLTNDLVARMCADDAKP